MSQAAHTSPWERTALVPRRRIGLRLAVLAVLVLFVLLGSPPVLSLLGFALCAALVLGTFPRAYVTQVEFEQEFFVMFIPVQVTRYSLKDFEAIETDVEERVGAWAGFLFGFGNLLWVWALDHLFPWFGGDFKIWLRALPGRRVLSWQGDGESRFKENLNILERRTGLPVMRR